MDGSQLSPTHVHVWATPVPTDKPVAEEEEYYSSWSLFLVCLLLILSLWTSYYLQIKRIRVIHETLVSIFAGMFVGLIVRLAPGNMIREMLVRELSLCPLGSTNLPILDIQTHALL
jgi:sodium/hydrogen exchanger-like protein 6/7